MQSRFEGADHDPYLRPGTAVVDGQALFQETGGDRVTCARRGVLMLPATPFFKEALDILAAGRQPDVGSRLSPRYKALLRQSVCDARGRFAFRDLPAGDWYVVTEVFWRAGSDRQGGGLMRRVAVEEGQVQEVLLTDADRVVR